MSKDREDYELDPFETWFASMTRADQLTYLPHSYAMRKAWNESLRRGTPVGVEERRAPLDDGEGHTIEVTDPDGLVPVHPTPDTSGEGELREVLVQIFAAFHFTGVAARLKASGITDDELSELQCRDLLNLRHVSSVGVEEFPQPPGYEETKCFARPTPLSSGEGELQEICNAFYEHIKHGDEKHRAWLKEECDGKLLELLRSRPSVQPQVNGEWRSIETAPKDGAEILLFRPAKCGRRACYAAARWLGYKERVPRWGWVMARSDETVAVFDEPLCWTHLPEPPNALSTTSVQEAEVAGEALWEKAIQKVASLVEVAKKVRPFIEHATVCGHPQSQERAADLLKQFDSALSHALSQPTSSFYGTDHPEFGQ